MLLAVLFLGLLAACGGGKGGGDGLSGVYKLSRMGDMTVQDLADALYEGDVKKAQSFVSLEIKSGGKGAFSTDSDSESITWEAEGEKFTLVAKDENDQDDIIEGTIKDGVITLYVEDTVLELKK